MHRLIPVPKTLI